MEKLSLADIFFCKANSIYVRYSLIIECSHVFYAGSSKSNKQWPCFTHIYYSVNEFEKETSLGNMKKKELCHVILLQCN